VSVSSTRGPLIPKLMKKGWGNCRDNYYVEGKTGKKKKVNFP
jgi:hypothetical protein